MGGGWDPSEQCATQLECVAAAGNRPLSASRGWACGAAGVPPGAARQPAPSHGSTCSGILGGVRVLQLTHGPRRKLAWHSEFSSELACTRWPCVCERVCECARPAMKLLWDENQRTSACARERPLESAVFTPRSSAANANSVRLGSRRRTRGGGNPGTPVRHGHTHAWQRPHAIVSGHTR